MCFTEAAKFKVGAVGQVTTPPHQTCQVDPRSCRPIDPGGGHGCLPGVGVQKLQGQEKSTPCRMVNSMVGRDMAPYKRSTLRKWIAVCMAHLYMSNGSVLASQ